MNKKKMNKLGIKKLPVLFMAAVLVTGVVAGAGIWLMDAEVPIEYDEPATVRLSREEYDDGNGYNWQPLEFREENKLEDKADFGATRPTMFYHQHIQIENPAKGSHLALEIDIGETGDDIHYTVMDGTVEPDEVNSEITNPRDEGSSIEGYEVNVAAGEKEQFTVIYELNQGIQAGATEEVMWNFYERISETVTGDESLQTAINDASKGTTLFVESENNPYKENITVNNNDITLYGVDRPLIEGRVRLDSNEARLEGFEVDSPAAETNQEGESVRVSNSADDVVVKDNLVRNFEKDAGEGEWWGIDGINVYGGDSGNPVEDVTILNNRVENLQNDVEAGAAGISIQGNVKGATVEGNEVTNIGMKNTAWAFGIVVRGTGNHDVVPDNIAVSKNTVNKILSDPNADTVGVGLGLESGDASDVDFDQNDISTTEFLLEDKTATINLEKFADGNTLDRGARLDGANIGDDVRNIIFNSTQDAIDAAETGDEILAEPGKYEVFNVNTDDITITAAGDRANTVIDVGSTERVGIKSNGVEVSGFTFNFEGSAVYEAGMANTQILDNRFELRDGTESQGYAVRFEGSSSDGELRNNEFIGINNTVDGEYGNGVVVSGPDGHEIIGNTFTNNSIGVNVGSQQPAGALTIQHNTFKDQDNFSIVLNHDDSGSPEIKITKNQIESSDIGILVLAGGDININENNIENNGEGVNATYSPDIVDATHNWWGASDGPSGDVEDPATGEVADGSGDSVSENVYFDPWLESEVSDAGAD